MILRELEHAPLGKLFKAGHLPHRSLLRRQVTMKSRAPDCAGAKAR
jgi:hypothetical protein